MRSYASRGVTSRERETAVKWGLQAHAFWYVAVNLIQVVVWWIFTPDQFFWPLYSLLSWGVWLAFHVWAVYSPAKVQRRRSLPD